MSKTSSSSPTSSLPTSTTARLHEQSALARARTNLSYLFSPSTSSAAPGTSLRLRLLLRTLHSLGTFLFWRLYRWAKYAVIGSAIAALGTVSVGGVGALGLLAAPTGVLGSAALGTLWGVGRWGWRRVWKKGSGGAKGVKVKGGEERGGSGRRDEARDDLVKVPW